MKWKIILTTSMFLAALSLGVFSSGIFSAHAAISNHKNKSQEGRYTILHAQPITISGKALYILTTSDGFILFYNSADTPTVSTCTGGCTQTWHPLLSNKNLFSTTPLQGNLTVQHTANGPQVAYNGHLLYSYAKDTSTDQMNTTWNPMFVQLKPSSHW